MPNANKGPTPQELVTAVSLMLRKNGIRRAAGAYTNSTDILYRVQHIPAGAQMDAAASGHEQVVIDFDRTLLDAANFGFEMTGMEEEPPRSSFPA